MSDARRTGDPPSSVPDASGRPSAAPGLPAPPPRRTTSSPNQRVVTAARAQPAAPTQAIAERLASTAADAPRNALSLFKEAWRDFRQSDRYFKYKAAILGAWVLLTCITLAVSCPSSELDANNSLEARFVLAGEPSRPIFMVVNDSDRPWREVMVVVNGTYRAAANQIEPHGNLTVTPKQLIGPNGSLPPPDLRVIELDLVTARGRVRLVKGGQVP